MARLDKRAVAKGVAKYAINPVVKAGLLTGLRPMGVVLLETRGRVTGRARHTPVGGRREGDALWVVSEHGEGAGYVRNIAADPRVRVRIGRTWHDGSAHRLPGEDWRERQRMMGRGRPGLKLNAAIVRMMRTAPLVIRIDLTG